MKNYRRATSLVMPVLVAAGCLMIPTAIRAAEDSTHVSSLLADAKTEALSLKADSEDMNSFVRSKKSWQSYAGKIEMVKGHVNESGKLLAALKDCEAEGSEWQQSAIRQIEPYLRDLATNTDQTIRYLNENQNKVHMPEFTDYVKANLELASNLEALIRDFVNYGESKQNFDEIGRKREIPS
jgi:hypothetical protein